MDVVSGVLGSPSISVDSLIPVRGAVDHRETGSTRDKRTKRFDVIKSASYLRLPFSPVQADEAAARGKRATGISLMCCLAKGMPTMVMARITAQSRWARAISQPKKTSQIR